MVIATNRASGQTIYAADINGLAAAVNGLGSYVVAAPTGVAATDTANIQAALDSVPAGGAKVILHPGVYKISSTIQIKQHNTHVQGAGAGRQQGATHNGIGTRLEASGTLSGASMMLVQLVGNTEPVHGVKLTDFALDGMGTATGDGLLYRSYRGAVRDIKIYRFAGKGFHALGYAAWDLYESQLSGVEVSGCAHGLFWGDGATDMHVNHCVLYDNNIGWEFFDGGSVQAEGVHIYNSTVDNLFFNGAGSRSKFSNFKIEGAGRHGVNIDSTNGGYSDLQFCNFNVSSNTDASTDNTVDAFIIQGAAGVTRTNIHGCNFSTKSANLLTRPRYYLYFSTSAQQSLVVGCQFDGNAGTGSVGGTGTGLANTTYPTTANAGI